MSARPEQPEAWGAVLRKAIADFREALAKQGKAASDEAARYVDMLRERDEALRLEREAHDVTRRASYDSDIHLRKQLKGEREAHEATKRELEAANASIEAARKTVEPFRDGSGNWIENIGWAVTQARDYEFICASLVEARREMDALRERLPPPGSIVVPLEDWTKTQLALADALRACDAIRREAFEEAARAVCTYAALYPCKEERCDCARIRALSSALSAEQYAALEGDCAPLACSPASAKGNGDE